MSAKVAFLEREVSAAERQPVTVVPKQAIVERDGEKVVFVVRDGRAVRTQVEAGADDRRHASRSPASQPGDRVIVKPLEQVSDGERNGRKSPSRGASERMRREPPAGRIVEHPSALCQVLPPRRADGAGAGRHHLRRRSAATSSALMGPSGSGKSDAAQPDRRHRQARRRARCASTASTSRSSSEGELADWRAGARRLHLPVLQPDAGADRVRERRAAAACSPACRAASRREHVESGARAGRPRRPDGALSRPSSPAASSSASRSRARSSPTRR